MNIFISYRGPIGWANRKIMGRYDLPSDIDLAAGLVKSGVFSSLAQRFRLTPGALFDVRSKAACSGTPAIALVPYAAGPSHANFADVLHSYGQLYGHYLASFYAHRSRLEQAIFAKMPLTSGFFEPQDLVRSPTLSEGGECDFYVAGGSAENSPSALSQVALNFTSQTCAKITTSDLGARPPLVTGLLLSFDCGLSDVDFEKILDTCEPDCNLAKTILRPPLPGKLVLYPEMEKDGQNFRWQSWLRSFLDYAGYRFFRSRKRKYSVTAKFRGGVGKRFLTKQKHLQPNLTSSRAEKSVLDLYRGGDGLPPTLGPREIGRIDEILCMREAGFLRGQFDDPPPGSILALYRGLSAPAPDPRCMCFPATTDDARKDAS